MKGKLKVEDLRIFIGGLFRCCIQTLDENLKKELEDGDLLYCAYCGSPMKRIDDAILWAAGR
jgi:hypothetical protein